MVVVLAMLIVSAVMSQRWRRRNGRPLWPPSASCAEEGMWSGADREQRRRVARAVRRGLAVDDTRTARLVCHRARVEHRRWENPWETVTLCLIAAIQLPNLLRWASDEGTPMAMRVLLFALLAVFVPYLLGVVPYRLLRLRRTTIAVELNLPLAERDREETPD
ncbi:hypothetical protein [Nocardiopsis dassonvillei]|uniref:hypothetical protein n=1 Tax=Nocardiopsis dassonvillei TaxID=2014 RepID=UPI003F57FDB6